MNLHPADTPQLAWWGTNEGGLPHRKVTGGRASAYVEPHEWNRLRYVTELPSEVLLFEARRTVRMHTEPVRVGGGRPDPHARWRDLVREDDSVTYARARCRFCTADGCSLLDAAAFFDHVVSPYVEGTPGGVST